MKTKISSKTLETKKGYEAPMLRSADVELEQGIAAGSATVDGSSMNKQWGDTNTQQQSVESPW